MGGAILVRRLQLVANVAIGRQRQPLFRYRRAADVAAQRLKRVFNIDIETCRECGGAVKVIACIEDPVVIQKILNHLKEKGEYQDAFRLPESRGPPQTSLLG